MKTRITRGIARRFVSKRIETNGGRTITWERDGYQVATIEIYVDTARLLDLLGPRALKTKKGKATLAGGAILAVVDGPRRHVKVGETE